MRKIIIILMLSVSFNTSFAQTVITTVGGVVFFDDPDSSRSKTLHEIAVICNEYIQQCHLGASLPLVFLDLELARDTSYWQLGYDNIYGNSIDNDIYERKTKDYTDLGIRIKSCDRTIKRENVLKLLDYGVNHVKELKALRTKA